MEIKHVKLSKPSEKPKKQLHSSAKNSLDIAFDSAIDFELDFDLDDFDLTLGEESEDEGGFKTRIMRPKMNVKNVSHKVVYRNAEKLAEKIDLTEGARTFAWVSGDFIFGDLLEALVMKKHISPKKIYICSLGMSQDNIDSLRNIIEWTDLEQLTILLSGYFYSHEKERLIPYLYKELDVGKKTQVVFSNYHCKIITVETFPGHFFTIHGSANMRSSNSIEQIVIEEGEELYRFNADIMDEQARLYGTINHDVPQNYYIRRDAAWQAVRESSQK